MASRDFFIQGDKVFIEAHMINKEFSYINSFFIVDYNVFVEHKKMLLESTFLHGNGKQTTIYFYDGVNTDKKGKPIRKHLGKFIMKSESQRDSIFFLNRNPYDLRVENMAVADTFTINKLSTMGHIEALRYLNNLMQEINPKMPNIEQRVSHIENIIYKIAKELDIEIA